MAYFNELATNTSAATGAANVPTTLLSDNIPSGVPDGNALAMHFETTGSGHLKATLNGRTIFDEDVFSDMVVDLLVWRRGNTNGDASGSIGEGATTARLADRAVSSLAWNNGQTLVITGTCATEGGLLLKRCGIAR